MSSKAPTLAAAAPASLLSRRSHGKVGNLLFFGVCLVAGTLVVVLLLTVIAVLVVNSQPSIQRFGIGFLLSARWDPVAEEFGALPFIYGTVVSSLLALLLAMPLSIGAAIFLVELTRGWLRSVLSFLIEALAAIPSVVYGIWGLFVLVPWLHDYVAQPLSEHLGETIPLFAPPALGPSMLSAAVILAIMVTPIITAVARDVLLTIPRSQREAAYALGATQWEVIRTVVGTARWGIFGAVILGLGRALGETMAVTMVIGNDPTIHVSLVQPAYTLASVIANEFTEATTPLYSSALVELGLVLLLTTLAVNVAARVLVWSIARRYQRR